MADIKDPIAFELFKNSIFSIADEMALTICRTTYSGVLRDNMDFSTAFADADGKLVAQGLTLPAHLGSIPTALDVIVGRFALVLFDHRFRVGHDFLAGFTGLENRDDFIGRLVSVGRTGEKRQGQGGCHHGQRLFNGHRLVNLDR